MVTTGFKISTKTDKWGILCINKREFRPSPLKPLPFNGFYKAKKIPDEQGFLEKGCFLT